MALTRIGSVGLATGININAGVGTFTGNLTVGGVLTYEDVTNVDSIGLITARNGIVVGSGITLSKDGDIFATGISTVKGIHINGTLEGQDLKVGTGVTITRDGDIFATGISTFTGGINLGDGDATVSALFVGDSIAHTGNTDAKIRFPETDKFTVETSNTQRLAVEPAGNINIAKNLNVVGVITATSYSGDGTNLTNVGVDTAVVFTDKISLPDGSGGSINVGLGSDFQIYHDGTNTYLDNSTGSLYIRGVDEKHIYIQAKSGENSIHCKDDEGVELYYDAVKKAETISGGFRVSGLLFGSDTAAANTLDDYEEGTFTPTVLNGWGFLNSSPTVATGKYVRIGAMVYIYFAFKEGSGTGGTTNGNLLSFYNLPYDADGQYGTSGDLSEPINAFCNSSSGNSENTFFRHSSNGATVGGVWKQTTSGHSAFTGTALGSSGQVMVAGWYRISGT